MASPETTSSALLPPSSPLPASEPQADVENTAPSDSQQRRSSLPAEIIAQILEELLESRRWTLPDLARCCQVSKTFLAFAIPLLYSRFCLDGDEQQRSIRLDSIRNGKTKYVKQLGLYVTKDGTIGTNEDDARALLKECSFVTNLDSEAEFQPLLDACIPLWTRLEILAAGGVLNGDNIVDFDRLTSLSTNGITFSPQATLRPPRFHLQSLHLQAKTTITSSSFLYLTSSSTHSLTSLTIEISEAIPTLPLHHLSSLRALYLSTWPDFEDGGDHYCRLLISILRTAPPSCKKLDLTCIDWNYIDDESLEEQDLLAFIPASVEDLEFDDFSSFPFDYLRAKLEASTFLPHLSHFICANRFDEDTDDELDDFEAMLEQRRPKLEFQWRGKRVLTEVDGMVRAM